MSMAGQGRLAGGRPAGKHVSAAKLARVGAESIVGASIEGGFGGRSIP